MYLHEILAFHATESMFGAGDDGFTFGKIRHVDFGGYTLDVASTPEDGYMVGGVVQEIVVPRDERLVSAAVEYLARGHVGAIESGQVYIGGWVNEDTGMVHVDVSEHYTFEYVALAAARLRNELAVWDVSNAREIRVADVPA